MINATREGIRALNFKLRDQFICTDIHPPSHKPSFIAFIAFTYFSRRTSLLLIAKQCRFLRLSENCHFSHLQSKGYLLLKRPYNNKSKEALLSNDNSLVEGFKCIQVFAHLYHVISCCEVVSLGPNASERAARKEPG